MGKLIVTLVSWGLCVLGAVMVQWFPEFSVLAPMSFISFSMMVWGLRKLFRGEIDPKNTPELFKWLSVPGKIAGILLIVFGFYVMLSWDGTGKLVDGAYYLVNHGTLVREITQKEYLFLLRSESRLFLGYGIAGGAKAAELWAADYWWYGPSVFNMQVREFFRLHK